MAGNYRDSIAYRQRQKAMLYGGYAGAYTDEKGRSWLQQQVDRDPDFIKNATNEDQANWGRDAWYHWKDQEEQQKQQQQQRLPSVNDMPQKGATVSPAMLDPKYVTGDYGLLQKKPGMVASSVTNQQIAKAVKAAQSQAGMLKEEKGFATHDEVLSGKFNWSDQSAGNRKTLLTDPNFYRNNQITKYTPAQQQEILTDPNFQWDQLPKLKIAGIDTGINWQEMYHSLSSSPAGMGAVQGAITGLGNPGGAVTGAVLGAAAGWSGYDQTKEWWEQGDKKWTWDKQQLKDNINAGMGLMQWGGEQAEKVIGTAAQVANAAADPTRNVTDLFKDEATAKATWEAGASFGEVISPAWQAAAKANGWTSDDILKIAPGIWVLSRLGDIIANPEKYKGEELYLGAANPVKLDKTWMERLDEVRTRIEKGEDYRQVMTDMQTGIMAQIGDMALQGVADPLNALPRVEAGASKILAETSGNKVLAEAYRQSSSPLEAKQKYKTLVQTGQALTIDPNFKLQDQQGVLSKFLGGDVGVNQRGEVKAGSVLPTETGLLDPVKERKAGLVGWVQNMAKQTPHSRAQQAAGMFYENTGAMMTMMDSPEDAAKYLSALSKNDMETFSQLGGKFAQSPEFYTVLPALKAFATEKLGGIVQNWEMTTGNRDMLTRLSDILGEEPAKLLDDLARNGTADQDFARVVDRLKNSTDPQAKAMLADVESGKFNTETLKRTVDIFTGDDALEWHPAQWKAKMLDTLGEHFDQWTADRLMLDKSPEATSAFFRTTALMKQAQSILLLGGSPGYALTNGMSNMVHRAATGVYGYLTPNQINGFMERMGMTPARMDEGVGIGGMVESKTGTGGVQTSAIDKAVKGKGPLTTAKENLGKLSKGMPFSKLSSWFESNESRQAFAIGMKQAWSQSWRRGVGFSKMSPELTQAISGLGVRPDIIYSAIEAGMNQAEVERALFGRDQGVQARSLVNDAAQKSGMSASQAADMLEKAGVLDALESRLQGRNTADGVRQAFAGVRRQAQDWADMQTGTDLKAIAENVKQRVGVEGATAALDVVQKAHGVFTDAWLDHYSRFGEVMNDLKLLDEPGQRSKAIELAYKQSDDEFRRVYSRHAANYQGIFEAWGMSNNTNAMRMLNAIGDVDDAMRNAYGRMREIRRGFFDKWRDDMGNPASYDEWKANDSQIDRIFKQAFETKRKAETAQGEALGNIYSELHGPAAGEAALQWWEEVVKFNDEIVQREKDFRDSLQDMDADDRRIAKQEYYQKDKVGMIVEADRINAEGIARLERAIKGGGSDTVAPTRPPEPTPSPVNSDQTPVQTSPSTTAQGEGGFQPAEVTDAQRVQTIKDAETRQKKTQLDRVEELNTLMKQAEQRQAAEAEANAERVKNVWDVAEGYAREGLSYDRAILQDKFALLAALKKEEYGGITDLAGLSDPRLTPELVKEILDRRQAVKESQAGQQVAQAMTNAEQAANNVKAPRIDENTPILKAMAEHGGLNTQHIPDITGNKRQKSLFVTFRKNGIGLDEMARMLADDGYPIDLNAPDDPGGIGQATALIQRALNKEKVYPVGHDYEAALAKAQNDAAVKAFDDSFDFENADMNKWQDDFSDSIQRGDLTRLAELIGDFPEELNKTLSPSGQEWEAYMSRMWDETAARAEAEQLYQRTYDHKIKAEDAIARQEVRAEAVTARQLMKEKFTDVFGLDERQAEAYMELSDAFAGFVSRATGENPDEFYSRYYGDVEKGGADTNPLEGLKQAYGRIEVADRTMTRADAENYARMLVRGGEGELRAAIRNEANKADRIAILDEAHKLDPKLAESVARGEMDVLFQSQGTSTALSPNIKGSMSWDHDAMKATIKAYESADFTTLVHENSHVFRRVIADVANRTGNAQIKADLRTLEDWAGAKDGVWDRAAEEKFARGFENYVATGKAPLPKLKAAFEMIRTWMMDVYKQITGSAIDVKITDDVKRVFDRMLGADNLKIDINGIMEGMGYDPAKFYVNEFGDIMPRKSLSITVDRTKSAGEAAGLAESVKGLQQRMAEGERVIGGRGDLQQTANVRDAIQAEAMRQGVGPLTDGQVEKLTRLPMKDFVQEAFGALIQHPDEIGALMEDPRVAREYDKYLADPNHLDDLIVGTLQHTDNTRGTGGMNKLQRMRAGLYEPGDYARARGEGYEGALFQDSRIGGEANSRIVETPEFKRWFGESKVVDEQGKPLVVYHGTGADFQAFDPNRAGQNFGIDKEGYFFTDNVKHSTPYMGEGKFNYYEDPYSAGAYAKNAMRKTGGGANVMPVYLKLENPMTTNDVVEMFSLNKKDPFDGGHPQDYLDDNKKQLIQIAKEEGYDGIWLTDGKDNVYVAFNPEQIKSTANRGTFNPADPNILFQEADQPFGAYDGAAQFHPQSEVMDAGWAQSINPLLDAMEQEAVQRISDPASRMDGMKDMSPEGQKMMRQYMNKVKTEMATTKLATVRFAEQKRDFAMLNYSRRYGFDRMLETVYPYQFYQTRTMVNWAARAVDNPAILANYARLQKQQNRYERDIPERLRGKIKIPAAWLPDWMGDSLYIDPIGNLFPPASLMKPVNRMLQDHNYQQIEAERILQEWAADGKYTQDEILKAAQSRSGTVYERAFSEAQMRRQAEVNNPMDFFNTMFGPAWYLTTPYKLATGKGEEITGTPLGNTSRAIETVTKGTWAEPVGQVFGLLGKAEDWGKKKLGIPEMGEYGDYYVDRQLANMVAEGMIDSKTAQMAMIERQGDIFEQAKERVKMELAMRVPLAGTLYAGLHGGIGDAAKASLPSLFGAGLLPAGELEYRGLKDEWNEAWKKRDAGDMNAVTDFFDEHPEYEAYLAKGKEPEERLRSFLVGQIWDGYMELGETNQKQARSQMGDLFQQSFLSKETRSYDTLTVDQLTEWARMLGQMTPKVSSQSSVNSGQSSGLDTTAKNQQSTRPALDLYNPNVTMITDKFFEQRTKNFPNYWEKQEVYYSFATKGEKARYLAGNPDLKAYFDWKDRWYKAYPEYKTIFNGQAFKQVDTSGWPPMLEDYVRDYAYAGGKLPKGASKALEQVWIQEGQPMGDFKTWLNSEIVPAMLYGQGQ